jgi:hypothetical protein
MKTNLQRILCLIFLVLSSAKLFSQGVGIGTTTPDPSAKLEIFSNSQGVLLPGLTSAQRDAIVNPAEGLQIFNIETKCYNFFKNSNWFELCGTCIPPASPTAGNNGPICSGDTLKLSASNVAGVSYSWSGPNGFTSSLQNPVIPNADTLYAGKYAVSVTAKNCSSSPVYTNAVITPLPDPSFSFSPLIPDSAESVIFTPATNWLTYNWTFQNGNPASSSAQNPSVVWNSKGTFNISLTITDNNCSATYTDTVHIKSCTGSQSFSASGTGSTGSMQSFVVPGCISSLTIEAWGAQGGNNGTTGGLGAYMKGTFSVTPGDVLLIGVGQQPAQCCSGAGGGGSSGVYNSTTSQHLIVAGGGGGGGYSSSVNSTITKDAVTGTSGENTYGCGTNNSLIASGGTGGSGGQGATNPCGDWPKGGGGGGVNSSGGSGGAGGGGAFSVNGGSGGSGTNGSVGGYGYTGGGGSEYGGGGGGGYSGGGGGAAATDYTSGGGGGSYNAGSNQSSSAANHTGDGQILISW